MFKSLMWLTSKIKHLNCLFLKEIIFLYFNLLSQKLHGSSKFSSMAQRKKKHSLFCYIKLKGIWENLTYLNLILLLYFVFKWPLLDESIETNFFKDHFVVLPIIYIVHCVIQYTTKLRPVILIFNAFGVVITYQIASLIKNLLTQRKKIHYSDMSPRSL